MNKTNNPSLTGISQILRKKMTDEERKLWFGFLKRLPITVNRQKTIGRYIVDFYCASKKLVIELDGSQHYKEANRKDDAERDEYLKSLGNEVVRYSNQDVKRNFEGVCGDLLKRTGLTWKDLKPSERQ